MQDLSYPIHRKVDDARPSGLFATNTHSRQLLSRLAAEIGFTLNHVHSLEELIEKPEILQVLNQVTIAFDRVDSVADAAARALKGELDVRADLTALVLVPMELLDLAWKTFPPHQAVVLVDPFASEISEAMVRFARSQPANRVREGGDADSTAIHSLMQEVSRLSERLDMMLRANQASGGLLFQPKTSEKYADEPAVSAFKDRKASYKGADDQEGGTLRQTRPALPDPLLVRRIIRQRQLRARFFQGDLFADPAWDILLDLTAARAEHNRVSVTSLCIASGVPPTTALRWIGQMVDAGLLQRVDDDSDRRRAFIALTDRAADAVARYFAELGSQASRLI